MEQPEYSLFARKKVRNKLAPCSCRRERSCNTMMHDEYADGAFIVILATPSLTWRVYASDVFSHCLLLACGRWSQSFSHCTPARVWV